MLVGQYNMVVKDEVPRIRAACRRAKIPDPALTLVVVGKRHHTRFFPANSDDADRRSGNAPAGLVVDREIVNPVEFDFFLQSHGGLLGTSRSAHYTCLVDENKFTADALQKLSFSLTHIYAKATRSVSIVAPTYYADAVCARAKHHYDPEDLQLLAEPAKRLTKETAQKRQDRLIKAYKDLHPNITHKMYFQ